MFQKLDEELKKLPKNFIVGIIASSDAYKDINMHILEFLMSKKESSGGYITVSRPYASIIQMMKQQNLNHDRVHFIDCITKTLGGTVVATSNCEFVSSPSSLTELSIALHNFASRTNDQQNRFLHIDSLSTLCIHNDVNSVMKFVHYVTGKMRIFGINGVMITLREDTDKKLISEISVFCDKMIHV